MNRREMLKSLFTAAPTALASAASAVVAAPAKEPVRMWYFQPGNMVEKELVTEYAIEFRKKFGGKHAVVPRGSTELAGEKVS